MPEPGILFIIAAFFSEVLGTMAGFGSSTVFLPIALFFFDFRTALILVAIFHMSGNIGRVTFFRHGFNRELIIRFGIPSVILTIIGAFLVSYVSQSVLKMILGVFLLVYVVISISRPDLSVKPTTENTLLGGSISGFFAGLIGTGGALRSSFLTSYNLEKSVYISTAAAISLAVDISRIPVYFASGYLPQEYYYYIPVLFLVAIAGSFVGKRAVSRIPQKKFRTFVLICIGLVSLKFIYDGLIFIL
ncbi:sulfite exporter TauE/SafE family protein [Methanolobus zinderi]|jgi:hypothetical protein|uniref:Probable membrane transporter protein n=1 Tax=Methanolobus zinderi TaxID=536044 RepID=A0A7D5E7A6_9EURY|nr:sulfite exporter TauE/SafE family protein [Methanolobus zinderi]KXS41399.1 MAG: hypothetical protein AWU59_2129 [Methanolobus sp. T82-4]QLC49271.1 sulfite exporter TauE/SafE family protein [Methanolobus zinderi]